MTLEAWMTKSELAAHLGCSVRTVTRLRLPHMRVGGQNRYRMSEVERYLRAPEGDDGVVVLFPERKGRAA